MRSLRARSPVVPSSTLICSVQERKSSASPFPVGIVGGAGDAVDDREVHARAKEHSRYWHELPELLLRQLDAEPAGFERLWFVAVTCGYLVLDVAGPGFVGWVVQRLWAGYG